MSLGFQLCQTCIACLHKLQLIYFSLTSIVKRRSDLSAVFVGREIVRLVDCTKLFNKKSALRSVVIEFRHGWVLRQLLFHNEALKLVATQDIFSVLLKYFVELVDTLH